MTVVSVWREIGKDLAAELPDVASVGPPARRAPIFANHQQRADFFFEARLKIRRILNGETPIPDEAPAWLRRRLGDPKYDRAFMRCVVDEVLTVPTLEEAAEIALGWRGERWTLPKNWVASAIARFADDLVHMRAELPRYARPDGEPTGRPRRGPRKRR